MKEERFQEIKDSVNFQRKILKAHNMGTLSVDEEQELIEEIERLNNGLKDIKYFIENSKKTSFGDLVIVASDLVCIVNIIDRLIGSDKE